MEYGKAQSIRRTSFSKMLIDKMKTQSITKSIGGTISDKFKANLTGIQESLDPLNVARKLTGGSNLAPAILGKLTGRKMSTIRHFTGGDKSTYKSLGPVGTTGDSSGALEKLYVFMVKSHEYDKKRYELEKDFKEEQRNEDQKNHEQFIEVLKMYTRIPVSETGQTVVQKTEVDESGLISTITNKINAISNAVGGIIDFLKGTLLFTIAKSVNAWFHKNFEKFQEFFLKKIVDFFKNNITKILSKEAVKSLLSFALGRLWTILTNPLTIAFLAVAGIAWAIKKFATETETGIKSQINVEQQRLDTLKRTIQGDPVGSWQYNNKQKEIQKSEAKLSKLNNDLDVLHKSDEVKLAKGEQEKRSMFGDTSWLSELNTLKADVVDPNLKKFKFSEFKIGENGETTATDVPAETVNPITPLATLTAEPPRSNLSKVIQEAGELEMRGYVSDQTTGAPVMFNNTSTSKLADKVPSTPASVRDMSPRVKESFDYLRKSSRAY